MEELRPKSYLVTPSIPLARAEALSDYNINHVKMTGQEFHTSVLSVLEKDSFAGLDYLKVRDTSSDTVRTVTATLTDNVAQGDYLLGSEPTWSDIRNQKSISRKIDDDLLAETKTRLKLSTAKGAIVVHGTAGTGKTTTLKRIALKLAADGIKVGWLDRFDEIQGSELTKLLLSDQCPQIIIIDDADVYGRYLSTTIRESALASIRPLFILGMRSSRIDRTIFRSILDELPLKELQVPLLTDLDIEALLQLLNKHNRLGILSNLRHDQRVSILKRKCDRQLIVAMIEATSDEQFDRKLESEYSDLEKEQKSLYAIASVATSLRIQVDQSAILHAFGVSNNTALNALKNLLSRGLLIKNTKGEIQVRHRLIADTLVDFLKKESSLTEIISGLAWAAAMQHDPFNKHIAARSRRAIMLLLNHRFLLDIIGGSKASVIYDELESLLKLDFNFWLQRGSLELEKGNLKNAEFFLNTAGALNASDMNTRSAKASLLLNKAVKSPTSPESQQMIEEARRTLMENITLRGGEDPHAFHILVKGMLSWLDVASQTKEMERKEVRNLLQILTRGCTLHSNNRMLGDLRTELSGRASFLGL
jgi:hypothetical protein